MEWLNYHHLLYFWVVAKEGSIVRASHELQLTHPTISAQIHRLEYILGEKLFVRRGRNLVLTDVGRVAFRYAEEIFSLGHEFLETLKGREVRRPLDLIVGVSDALPKSIVYRLLEPVFRLNQAVRIICHEDMSTEAFLGELALHKLDLVLSDAPAGPGTPVRAFNHLLGESSTTFFASPQLSPTCRQRFPRSLDGVPFLLPGMNSLVCRDLKRWFDSQNIRPRIVGEIDDAALAKVLCEKGIGVFAGPTLIEAEIRQRSAIEVVGRSEAVRQHFYAISVERKLKHPAVIAICDTARKDIFSRPKGSGAGSSSH